MRRADWRARLAAVYRGKARAPYKPGTHDCARVAADAIRAVIDLDLGRGLRGKYRSVAQGERLVQARGYSDHVAYLTAPFAEIDAGHAMTGDLAVIAGENGSETVGVVDGRNVRVVVPGSGFVLVPLRMARRIYGVR